MSTTKSPSLVLLFLLLLSSSPPAESFSIAQLRSLISLSHSLMNRIADLRASRGDYSGAQRAKNIAEKLEGGLGFWRGIVWTSWDYLRSYSWRDMSWTDMSQTASDFNQLLKALGELASIKPDMDRVAWIVRNYQKVLGILNSLLRRLLQVFVKSGPMRDLVLTVQKEVEGGLLRDCLELGTNDLKGLMQIIKDIGMQFSQSNGDYPRYDL